MICKNLIIYLCLIITSSYGRESNKLEGGTRVQIRLHPSVVSILWIDSPICGGTIITPLQIITTASCLSAEDKNIIYGNLKVLSGISERNNHQNNNETVHNVARVILHDEYSPSQFWTNDIAILKLEKSISFNRDRKNIRLSPLTVLSRLSTLKLISWEQFELNSIHLSKIKIDSLLIRECQALYKNYFVGKIHEAQYCIIPLRESQKILNGDSGGPICTIRHGNMMGMVSLVFMNSKHPTIITQVPYYQAWITQMIDH